LCYPVCRQAGMMRIMSFLNFYERIAILTYVEGFF
jgi:hypothetical protein